MIIIYVLIPQYFKYIVNVIILLLFQKKKHKLLKDRCKCIDKFQNQNDINNYYPRQKKRKKERNN